MLAVVGVLVAVVFLNIFGSSTFAKACCYVCIAFGSVIFFEANIIYCKIMKVLYKVVDNISLTQVVVAVISNIFMYVSVCCLGYNNAVFYFLFPLAVILRLVFKISQVNRTVPFLCSDLDEEIASFNAEDFQEQGSCDCGCGNDHDGECGCGDDCSCENGCSCGKSSDVQGE